MCYNFSRKEGTFMKKSLLALCLLFSCSSLISCGEYECVSTLPQHDRTAWFNEEELNKVGLSSLPAPTGLEGDINSDVYWFNDGYSFSQSCPNQEVLNTNATTYLNYFKSHYDKAFGTSTSYASGSDVIYYYISVKNDVSAYYDDNPSPLYKFYYVTDTTLAEDGCLKEDAVWSLEIRYELNSTKNTYDFKLFIENESKNHSNTFQYKYNLK